MNAHNPLAEKFQITDKPMALPAKCVVCGAVDRPVLDFGMSLDWYGAILFCIECMASAARAINYAPVAEIEERERSAQAVYDRQDEVVTMLNNAAVQINDLTAGLSRAIDDILRSGPVAPVEMPKNIVSNDGGIADWSEPATESVFESARE